MPGLLKHLLCRWQIGQTSNYCLADRGMLRGGIEQKKPADPPSEYHSLIRQKDLYGFL